MYLCYFKLIAQDSDSCLMALSSICCLLFFCFKKKKTFSTPLFLDGHIFVSVHFCFSHSLHSHIPFVQDLSVVVLAFTEICVYGKPPYSFIPPSCDKLITIHYEQQIQTWLDVSFMDLSFVD